MAGETLIEIRNQRIEKAQKLRELGLNPYPSKSKRDKDIAQVIDSFGTFADKTVVVAGRLLSWREHGKLIFGHIQDQSGKVQLYIREDTLAAFNQPSGNLGYGYLNLLDVGDIVEATGIVTKTQRGEISILVKEIRILTKSIRPLPSAWFGMVEKEERYRRRYLDMTLNPDVRKRFERRSQFWQAVRDFLIKEDFVEINIPVLEHVTGGADAKPFVTHYDALHEDFYLRISHELPLKRLLGGGFHKIFDIGPRFRNEGFSDEHLPEHVAMEWYWAYADYRAGMDLTRRLYQYVLQTVYKTLKFEIKGFMVDLSGDNWPEINYSEIIAERFGVDIFNTDVVEMNRILVENGVKLDGEASRARVVDNLWKLVRKTISGPAFLVGEPKFMSPLAKSDDQNPELTERFHLLIAGSELANAYSELNDPIDQLNRFTEQQRMRQAGDDEAQMLDIDFVEMLEYGMPPAVGFGLSERVFWFFENVTAKEGVPFPQLKNNLDPVSREVYRDISDLLEQSNTKEKQQDFSQKMVIVVNESLEQWQVVNAVAHVSAYIGNKLDDKFATGSNFVTQDGRSHPRNSQYPIITLKASANKLQSLMQQVRDQGLLYHGFIREMLATTNDQEIVAALAQKPDAEVEYLAIGMFGDNELVATLTKKFSLWK